LASPKIANMASLVFDANVPLEERTLFSNFIIKRKLVFYLLKNLKIEERIYMFMNALTQSIDVLENYDKIQNDLLLNNIQQLHASPPLKGKLSF
jgi:hypothetical protein